MTHNDIIYNEIIALHQAGCSYEEISEVLGVYDYVVKAIIA